MVSISSPGELIASVVPVLGFEPVESLVLVALDKGKMAVVLRGDLATPDLVGLIGDLAIAAVRSGADAAVAVVVSADVTAYGSHSIPTGALVNGLGAVLDGVGIRLLGSYLVDRVAAGGRWTCSDGSQEGVLQDPLGSVLAAETALSGKRFYGKREAIGEMLAVNVRQAETVAELVGAFADEPISAISEAVAAVRVIASNDRVADEVLARVGASLADLAVRDALLSLAVSDLSAAAESLWIQLARVLPSALRAEALAMVAYSAYARGDGALAGAATDAALAERPDHGLAGLLSVALDRAIVPQKIRALVEKMPQVAKLM